GLVRGSLRPQAEVPGAGEQVGHAHPAVVGDRLGHDAGIGEVADLNLGHELGDVGQSSGRLLGIVQLLGPIPRRAEGAGPGRGGGRAWAPWKGARQAQSGREAGSPSAAFRAAAASPLSARATAKARSGARRDELLTRAMRARASSTAPTLARPCTTVAGPRRK